MEVEVKTFNGYSREGDLFLNNVSISFQNSIALFGETARSQRVVGKRAPFPQFSLQA